MSKQNLSEFWKKVENDPELRKRLDSMPGGAPQEIVAGLVRIGSEHGLPFTAEEFGETASVQGTELSDQSLDRVAGGLQSNGITSKVGLLSDERTSRLGFRFSNFRLRSRGGQ